MAYVHVGGSEEFEGSLTPSPIYGKAAGPKFGNSPP